MSDSVSSSAYTIDTSASLCDLRRQNGKPLMHSVIGIYKYQRTSNSKSLRFWENLQCFFPQKFDTEKTSQDRRLSAKIPLELHSPRNGYVALSYCWYPSKGESKASERYRKASDLEKPLKVSDIVLDRTFRFIRYKQVNGVILPLWIDQLSIDQEDTPEKEVAMQSMDLVYKECTYAIGYLWVQLQTQMEMNRLSDLLSGRIVESKLIKGNAILVNGIEIEVVHEVLDLLTRITNDQWWTRAWIFQEDYLAGRKMWLIIRHVRGLRKPLMHNKLGSL
ncbi:heterokaryon incompatibility protein-domain-containing protein [Phaeosphaeriaceae sp. PMI808]|nr:heterokaryon incompatibility protein-domain-containing protein [Phaeosphaeriaceae sp. PMI808]